MNKKKILIIIVVIVFLTLAGGIVAFGILNGSGDAVFSTSSSKVSTDESGVDWSKYQVYDVKLGSGKINITRAGVYNLTGTLKNGSIIVSTDDNVKIVLNEVTITSKSEPAIYIKKAKNAYIELVGDSKIISKTSDSVDAAIFSKDDLYLCGSGSLEINSNKDGISSKDDLYILSGSYAINSDNDGIKGKDSVSVTKGNFTITAGQDGIKTTNEEEKGEILIENGTFKITSSLDGISASSSLNIKDGKYTIVSGTKAGEDSQKGLKGIKEVVLLNGTYSISSIDDAIHSNGNVTIENGDYTISSNDDGIHADSSVTIKDGNVKVTKAYEGIEGYSINLVGGKIETYATDDGINVGGGNDSSGMQGGRDGFDQDNGGLLTISGGEIYVNADGDGLDSNGSIKMSGGTVHVDGPTNNGNGALDYNGTFEITGGELVAVGSSGMMQNVSNSSTQNTILVNLSSSTSGDVSLGNISYSPKKQYQSILISSASLELNKEYTLKTGSTSQSVTLTSTVTGSGSQMGQGGMGGPGGNMRPGGTR